MLDGRGTCNRRDWAAQDVGAVAVGVRGGAHGRGRIGTANTHSVQCSL